MNDGDGIDLGADLSRDASGRVELIIPNTRLATQKMVIAGAPESGKSYAAGVVVEGLLKLGIVPAILDNVGTLSGINLDATGQKASGFQVAVFGGPHRHLELKEDMGPALARFVLNDRVPICVDMTGWYPNAQCRLVAEFTRELMKLAADKRPRTVLVLEEAAQYAPEKIGFKEQTLSQTELIRFALQGRNLGLGGIFLTQRLQDLVKQAVDNTSILLMMRSQGRALARAQDWLKEVSTGDPAMEAAAEGLLPQIVRLPTGTGILMSPGFMGRVAQVRVRTRETFHMDPESPDLASAEAMATSVNVTDLRRKFARFNAPEPKPAPVPKGRKETAAEWMEAEALGAPTLSREVERLKAENETLTEALDRIAREREDEQQSFAVRLAAEREIAAREAQAELGRIRAAAADALQIMQGIATNGKEGTVPEESRLVSNREVTKINRLLERARENTRLKRRDHQILEALAEDFPHRPTGMSNAELARELKTVITSGGGFIEPILRLRKYGYVEATGRKPADLVTLKVDV